MAILHRRGYANDWAKPTLRERLVSVPLESIYSGMGANLVGDECSFRVLAPNAIAVSVGIWYNERMSQVALAPEPSNSSYWSAFTQPLDLGWQMW